MSYSVDRAFEILTKCFMGGGKLLLCGNGGSAADCDHIAAELVNGMTKRTTGLPAISLCSNGAIITAIGNDRDADSIFSQQVQAYGNPSDVLLAITTSGKSKNIIKALRTAYVTKYMRAIALIGSYADKVEPYSDLVIACPGANASEIQEQHIKVYHELCRRLEEDFFP